MNRRKILIIATVVLVVVGLAAWFFAPKETAGTIVYTTVSRQDLRATVSSTGTLSALETVEVGTQVSGQVARVFVDYNDRVQKGQLLAVLDTENLDASVRNGEAGVSQANAQHAQALAQLNEAQARLNDAKATLNRNQSLAKSGFLSQSEFQPIETAVQTAEASVASARAAVRSAMAQVTQSQAQLAQARKNRMNAEIRAPIGGIVVERSVDEGQTVAASFNTPTLFVIAENLEQMQILTDVDESDIGQITTGQSVTFTVPAFPEESYTGTVREIRLQPVTEQNVVTYTVVVDAVNRDGKLLPGMTATVDFVTGEKKNVLTVSTAALQLQPTPEMQAAQAAPDAPKAPLPGAAKPSATKPAEGVGTLWYEPQPGKFQKVQVRTGLSSGALTEIIPTAQGDVVKPGFKVIEQVVTPSATAQNSNDGPPRPM